ncbi:hypothetical protein ScPMuIL_004461 [Solemya velum]
MGDLVEFFEAQGQALDSVAATSPSSVLLTNYTSCIRVNGVPILPPVLTPKRRTEMKSLKREAMKIESKIRTKRNGKLVEKVQSIVAGVEERRACKTVSSYSTDVKHDTTDGNRKPKSANIRLERRERGNLLSSKSVDGFKVAPQVSESNKRQLPELPKTTSSTKDVSSKIPTPPKETKHQHDSALDTKVLAVGQKRAARLGLKASSKRSISQPDLREIERETNTDFSRKSNMKNLSRSEMDLTFGGKENTDENEININPNPDLFPKFSKWKSVETSEKKKLLPRKESITVKNVTEEGPGTFEFGTSTASDFTSLEDCNSLPQDLNGMPFTSVRQQQISHVLSKLSKELNIQDTLSSTVENMAANSAQAHSPNNPSSKQNPTIRSDSNTARSPEIRRESSSSSVASSTSYLASPSSPSRGSIVSDTPNTTSNSVLSSGGNTSGNTSGSSSRHRMSPTASILSSASSVSTGQPKGPKASPKNLKNTVHFSSFVTEISTSASQSIEDKISVRKLNITPTSSVQFTESDQHKVDSNRQLGTKSNTELTKNITRDNHFLLNNDFNVDRPPDSMLSRVALSPEGDSPGVNQNFLFGLEDQDNLPFQTYSSEGEPNSSDKENMEYGVIVPSLHSTDQHGRNVPMPNHSQSDLSPLEMGIITASQNGSSFIQSGVVDSTFQSVSQTLKHTGRSQPIHVNDSQIPRYNERSQQTPFINTQGTSVKSSIKSQSSESESSTLKGSQDQLMSCTKNLTVSKKTDNLARGQTTGNLMPDNSASVPMHHPFNIDNSQPNVDKNTIHSRHLTKNENFPPKDDIIAEVKRIRKHVRKGSYTLDRPSPTLLRSVTQCPLDKNNSSEEMFGDNADTDIGSSASKPVPAGLDMECEEEEEEFKMSQKVRDVYAEKEGKAAHIQKYLSQIHNQTHSPQPSPSEPTHHSNKANKLSLPKLSDISDVGAVIQSFTESLSTMNHLSEEQLVHFQAEQFEVLRASLIEQQKQQLETLFVQQRKEQLHLQSEIEVYHKHLKDQEVLMKSSSETMNSSKVSTSKQNNLSGDPTSSQQSNNQFTYVPSPSLDLHPKDRHGGSHFGTPDQPNLFEHSPHQRKSHRPVVRSPIKGVSHARKSVTVFVPGRAYDDDMQMKFERVSACVKGYLTRRLMETEKVQSIKQTIRDTREFASNFQSETPLKQGNFTQQDLNLLERIIAQLQAALMDIHEIFFVISVSERMGMIQHSRQLLYDKQYRIKQQRRSLGSSSQRRISTATQKAIDRKKRAQEAELTVFGDIRPSSAPPATSSPRAIGNSKDLSGPLRRHFQFLLSRALRPIQGQLSPIQPENTSREIAGEKDRPKTAPSKGLVFTKSSSTSNVSGHQSRPSNTKPRVTSSRLNKTKSGKAWR